MIHRSLLTILTLCLILCYLLSSSSLSTKRWVSMRHQRFSFYKIHEGSLIEYVTPKNMKKLCLVQRRLTDYNIEVINEAKLEFKIPVSKVSAHFEGSFAFGDLLKLNEMLAELSPRQIERVWEGIQAKNTQMHHTQSSNYTIEFITDQVFGVVDPVRVFVSQKLMNLYGSIFFMPVYCPVQKTIVYVPLEHSLVHDNLRDRASLREFKQRYIKISTAGYNSNTNSFSSDIPDRILTVLERYIEGLKQIVVKSHPWVVNQYTKVSFNETEINKAKELLDFLQLAPVSKNARKLLEVIGVWNAHTNIEKYVMAIRDVFPIEVLEESQYILDNHNYITDMDERIRRDLRYLRAYAIDSEGANEVDDAISIEHVMVEEKMEDGSIISTTREKLWIHIADVSRWVKPGSQLSLEAERRMSSVYMPDERISMFPEELSTQLLSLGAMTDSFALSCGVMLHRNGSIESFEVCPSKVRITRKLSYAQLEEVIASQGLIAGVSAKSLDRLVYEDISGMNQWAGIRNKYRRGRGALDLLMRDKTELYLSIRREPKNPSRVHVSGYTQWSNGSSMSLVTEFMILMSETIGLYCSEQNIPVLYKTQLPTPGLETSSELELKEGENPYIRTTRLIKCIKPAVDSSIPGQHVSSGSSAYVQCTSPIRRYHDLYNHYRLKASMHAASLGSEFREQSAVEELAGISALDAMSSVEDRTRTLEAIKLVTRNREQYWLREYIDRLIHSFPPYIFECMIYSLPSPDSAAQTSEPDAPIPPPDMSMSVLDPDISNMEDETDILATTDNLSTSSSEKTLSTPCAPVLYYESLILQLGTFTKYLLYSSQSYKVGEVVRCHLYRRYHVPQLSYLLLPIDYNFEYLPNELKVQLRPKRAPELDNDSLDQQVVPLKSDGKGLSKGGELK